METLVSRFKEESPTRSVVLQSPVDRLATDLAELVEECGAENWDGYGAAPLDKTAVSRGKKLLHLCPPDLPDPDIYAMPNGDLALDWDFDRRRTLSVTIAASPRLAWAVIHGDEEFGGTLSFIDQFPERLASTIRSLMALA